MAELADALDLGSSWATQQVRFLLAAPNIHTTFSKYIFYICAHKVFCFMSFVRYNLKRSLRDGHI